MNLRLHKDYGVNPSLVVCFFCGKETGEIALLGHNNDKEAPKHTCLSYEPCAECIEAMKQGFTIMEATEVPNSIGQPSYYADRSVYPTGRYIVVHRDCPIAIEFSQGGKYEKCFLNSESFNQFYTSLNS